MNRHLRHAMAEIAAAGATVQDVKYKTHIEITIDYRGRRGVLRVHRGSKVHNRAERGLRSAIRRIIGL